MPKRFRHRRGRTGKVLRGSTSVRKRKLHTEPWHLATNLEHQDAAHVVSLYGLRMRVEQTFRDMKSESLGHAFRRSRTRSAKRLAVLILIGVLAWVALWLIGQRALALGLHRHLQANTERRSVLSVITVGRLVLTSPLSTLERQLLAPPGR
jgi:ferric-dicitrate binding protein FerR (iron transport regulator)